MVELDENGRVTFDRRVYGLGKFLQFIYDNFFAIRAVFFTIACLCLTFSFRLPMFLFVVMEGIFMWCQFKAPLIDQYNHEQFAHWVDESVVQSGGESCHCLNAILEKCFESMMPDFFSDWYASQGTDSLRRLAPLFITDVECTKFSWGYSPPRYIQILCEESPPFPGSAAFQFATVFTNEWSFEIVFKMFGLPCTIVCSDIVMYATIRAIVETPEENKFMYLQPITCVGYTAVKPFKVLSMKLHWNGFDVMKIPMIHRVFLDMAEATAYNCMGNGEVFYCDWVTSQWKWRNLTRMHSDLSENLFKGIAVKHRTEVDPGRFSMSAKQLARWDETLKAYNERIAKTKLNANEELVWMEPNPEAQIEPVFEFIEEKPPRVDIAVQVENL